MEANNGHKNGDLMSKQPERKTYGHHSGDEIPSLCFTAHPSRSVCGGLAALLSSSSALNISQSPATRPATCLLFTVFSSAGPSSFLPPLAPRPPSLSKTPLSYLAMFHLSLPFISSGQEMQTFGVGEAFPSNLV